MLRVTFIFLILMWGVSNFQRVKTICDKQEQ